MRQPLTEHERWKAEADALGITLSDYVRAKVDGAAVKVVRVADPALLAELRRHGNNLNQITHAANGNIYAASGNAAIAALQAYYLRLLEEAV